MLIHERAYSLDSASELACSHTSQQLPRHVVAEIVCCMLCATWTSTLILRLWPNLAPAPRHTRSMPMFISAFIDMLPKGKAVLSLHGQSYWKYSTVRFPVTASLSSWYDYILHIAGTITVSGLLTDVLYSARTPRKLLEYRSVFNMSKPRVLLKGSKPIQGCNYRHA